MQTTDIEKILRSLGCSNIKVQPNGWVRASCPFKWKHKSGDRHPSFAVVPSTEQKSHYKCLSCGEVGSMVGLVKKLDEASGGKSWATRPQYAAALNLARQDQDSVAYLERKQKARMESGNAPTGGWFTKKKVEIAGVEVTNPPFYLVMEEANGVKPDAGLPETDLDQLLDIFPPAVMKWLTDPKPPPEMGIKNPSRGLTPQTIKDYGLLWSPTKKRVAMPVRDVTGKLVCITGRATEGWQKPKFLHSSGFRRDLYLYGEHVSKKGGRGILVEGHFDAQVVRQKGYPRVNAVMGSYLAWTQAQKLIQWYPDGITILRDGDEAGILAAAQWKKMLQELKPGYDVTIPTVPPGYDPDDHSEADLWELLGDPDKENSV